MTPADPEFSPVRMEASSDFITHVPQRPGWWKHGWRRTPCVHLWGVCTPGHLLSGSRRGNVACRHGVYWVGRPRLTVPAVHLAQRGATQIHFLEGSSGLDTFEQNSRYPAFFGFLPSHAPLPRQVWDSVFMSTGPGVASIEYEWQWHLAMVLMYWTYWDDTTFESKPSSQAGLLGTLGEAQSSLAHAQVLSSPEVIYLPPVTNWMGN